MAAYAALTSLSETTELLHQKIILQKSTDEDDGVHRTSSRNKLLQQLQNEIESLRENTDFLLSALEKSPTHPFEAQMKDAADQAQVIIGRFVLDQLRPERTVDDDDLLLQSLSHQLQRTHDGLISSMVEKINNNPSDETDEVSVIGIFDSSLSRSKYPLRNAKAFAGTWEVLHELGNYLFVDSSAELRVASIVGMGGLGKTTVARMFYNYGLRSELFEVTGWVTVSQDFSARDILVSLLASIKPFITQPKQRNESIENHIHKNLEGRRFLIVLDDVWSPEALRLLMSAFPDDGNGSGIVVTTRKEEVAAVETTTKKPTRAVNMRFLNPDESSELLWSEVFEDEHCPDELEDLSRNIVTVCEGLPLAIVLVAGILLASDKSLHEWNYVFKNLSVDYKSRDEMVDAVLSLSYKHLPHRLRTCLLHMGAFPEDHEINVARLTKQLSAQGFQHKSASYEVEQCLQYLGNRNLVSVPVWKYDNLGIKRVCLHDMVREFCLKKAREEKFLHCVTGDDSNQDLAGRKIQVAFNLDNLKRICNSDDADYDTHTIMCFGNGWTRTRPLISIGRFKLLKSLDLANVEIESLPNEVLNLFLLRLLALGHVPELPPSISNLRNLETLIINTAKDASSSSSSMTPLPRILCVPSEIWTISQLRHIVSFCCGPLPSPNREENSPLENLETLNAVMNLDCSEDLIEMIPNVKKLGMFYFGVERATHSIKNIERLSRLEKLKVWVMVPFSSPQNLNLGFPNTLRKLTLRGIRLSHGDMSIIGQLPRLRLLKLIRNDFERDEWRITTAHGFEKLQVLLLEESGLRHWSCDCGEDSVFPMLDVLAFRTCNELNEIEGVVQNVPSLKILMLLGCKNKSLVESVSRIRQSNENLNVSIRNYG